MAVLDPVALAETDTTHGKAYTVLPMVEPVSATPEFATFAAMAQRPEWIECAAHLRQFNPREANPTRVVNAARLLCSWYAFAVSHGKDAIAAFEAEPATEIVKQSRTLPPSWGFSGKDAPTAAEIDDARGAMTALHQAEASPSLTAAIVQVMSRPPVSPADVALHAAALLSSCTPPISGVACADPANCECAACAAGHLAGSPWETALGIPAAPCGPCQNLGG